MARILSDAELIEATGYKRPADQLRALRAIGMRPVVGPGGVPRVTWEAFNAAVSGQVGRGEAANEAPRLNWSAVGAGS